jgi:hypothetical protein
MFRATLSRFAGLFGKARFDREIEQEIGARISLLTDRFISQGMTPEEARHAARRRFGGVAQLQEDLRERRGSCRCGSEPTTTAFRPAEGPSRRSTR